MIVFWHDPTAVQVYLCNFLFPYQVHAVYDAILELVMRKTNAIVHTSQQNKFGTDKSIHHQVLGQLQAI